MLQMFINLFRNMYDFKNLLTEYTPINFYKYNEEDDDDFILNDSNNFNHLFMPQELTYAEQIFQRNIPEFNYQIIQDPAPNPKITVETSNPKIETVDETTNESRTKSKSSSNQSNNIHISQELRDSLIRIDIEDLLRSEGITSVNGKKIKFGNKGLRSQNASYGAKNSYHKKRDPHTGNAMARDISIPGGSDSDYAEFRKMLLSNERVRSWMAAKGWGIINEITSAALKRTRGTGKHFHFGPDKWAIRTWKGWVNNPTIDIRKLL